MTVRNARPLPASRLGRLASLGRLGAGLLGGALGEATRRLAQGERPSLPQVMLTPSSARQLADRLAEMRGAAMKVGQLLSMDSGQVLPPEVSEILSRLRQEADYMPLGQVAAVLNEAWGEGWEKRFKRFIFTPLAAASIGQVHRAELKDGRQVAIKVQYPGIRRSIDSDVDNVATLLKLFRLVPDGLDLGPLLAAAKQQLHIEADYQAEAAALRRFAERLGEDERFTVPGVIDELTTPDVLTMEYLDGEPIETLDSAPRDLRDRAGTALLDLALREIFDWGLVQTDPNFANYRYDPHSGRIQLLDFGATRHYPPEQQHTLTRLLDASAAGDRTAVRAAAEQAGYLGAGDTPDYQADVISLLWTATTPLRGQTHYPFGSCDLAGRMSETLVRIRLHQRAGRIPPADILFLHRKLAGIYLLLVRLRATVPVSRLVAPYVSTTGSPETPLPQAAG